MAKRSIKIQGKLSDTIKQPIAKLRIEAWDKDMLIDDFVGEALSDERGAFTISFTQRRCKELFADRNPDIYFKIYDGDSFIQSTENSVLWNIKNETVVVEIVIDREKENPPVNKDQGFKVQGHVRNSDGSPFVGGLVYAYDKDLRTEVLLRKAITNEAGYYEIVYSPDKLGKTNKGNADLQIRVFEHIKDGEDKLLVESEIFFNAAPVQEINLTLTATTTIKEKSEWERVCEQVLPLLKGQKVTDNKSEFKEKQTDVVFEDLLPGELNHDDFDFISKETGLDKNNIQLWSLAYSRSKEVNSIAAEIFYGWFRMGLPTELKDLWARTTDELLQKLKEAIDRNIIPVINNGMEKIITAINQARQDFHLQPAKEGEKASVGDVLNTAGKDWLSDEKKKSYVDIAKELDPDADEDFNKKINAIGFTTDEKNTLQKTLRLDKLTLSHPPLMEALHTYVRSDTDASLKPLATIHNDQWIDLAYTHGVPAGSTLAPEDYAIQLASSVEDRLPTASLESKVSNGEILFNQPGIEKIAPLLKAVSDLDIVKDDIAAIAVKHKLDDESKGLLKKLQNLKKLGARWEDTDAFINQGITSVQQIVEYSPEQLKAIFKDDVEPEKIAIVQANAIAAQNIGIGLMGYLQPALYGVKAYVMESSNGQKQGRSTGSSAQPLTASSATGSELDPTLRTLFGALEQCACDPCLSVLSPAAYYADLLKFIDTNNIGNNIISESNTELRHASVELRKRRPDLYDLELSCDNSEIVLPYIDLCLEILENAVVMPKEINLTPGESFWEGDPKSRKISEAVKRVLQSTSEDRLTTGDFNVESYLAGGYDWVIQDHFRRWAINVTVEYFGQSNENAPVMNRSWWNIDQSKIKDLLKWLNDDSRQVISASIKDYFESGLLHYHNNSAEPRSIVTCNVEKIESDRLWNINFETQTIVEFNINPIDKNKTEITIASADRSIEIKNEYSTITSTVTETGLQNGKRAGILLSKRNETKESITKSALGSGYLITNNYTIKLHYSIAKISIEGLTYQSTAKDRDLLARAQNKNPLAYDELAKASSVYPWSLPYDQYLTEVRILLNKAGIPRLDLINSCLPDDKKYTDAGWVKEVLKISLVQQKAITTPQQTFALSDVWGFKVRQIDDITFEFSVYDTFQDKLVIADRPEMLFQTVSIVMQQANIGFNELQDLLASRFINPDNIYISNDNNCDPTQMLLKFPGDIQGAMTDQLNPLCDRMHRFIRLWRATGLSISELDQAIIADSSGNKVIIDSTIVYIARLKVLQQKLNISFQTAIDLFTTFKNEPAVSYNNRKRIKTKSLYDKIFQNIHLQNPANPDFEFNNLKARAVPADVKGLPELSYVSTCLRIRLTDLNRLIDLVDINADLENNDPHANPPKHPSNIDYLYSLWRNISLANILQLAIPEYAAARHLINNSESVFTSPETLLNFCDEVAFVKKSGIGFEVLENILTPGKSEFILPVETANYILKGLKDELLKCKKFYFKENVLTANILNGPSFTIPATDIERWERWGFQKNSVTGNWEINSGNTLLSGNNPFVFIRQQDLLAQQCHIAIPGLNKLLNTNFVTAGRRGLLKAEINAATNISEIKNLTAVHLDRIERFLALQTAFNSGTEDLDIFLSAFIDPAAEPLAYDLHELVKNNFELILQRKNTVTDYLSRTFNLSAETVNDLMYNHFTISKGNQTELAIDVFIANTITEDRQLLEIATGIRDTFIKLQKIYFLNSFWKTGGTRLKWLRKSTATTGYLGLIPNNLQPAVISYKDWKQSTLLFSLAQTNTATELFLSDYLKAEKKEPDGSTISIARTEVLANIFSLKIEDVNAAAIKHGMEPVTRRTNEPADNIQFDTALLTRLFNHLSVLQQSGLTEPELESLVADQVSIQAVQLARKLLYVRYGKNFATALQDVNNKLRMEQRDRLADYLCWRDNLRDANDLYKKYLIDIEMQPCMKTTRLLQATAAAQLFVYRCLMNLEENISPESFNKKRWEWTQNYRVWEANRKVFLYPENWLYPELRDDKTEPFKEMEGKLQTGNLVASNTKEVIRKYLRTVSQHSNIMVKGLFEFETTDNGKVQNNLLVIGRMQNQPLKYFWRVCSGWPDSNLTWTSWKEIRSDVSSLYVIPYAIDGEPYLAWPIIKEVEIANVKQWSVIFKWTSLKDEKVSESYSKELFAPKYANKDIETSFTFKVNVLKTINEKYFTTNRISKSIAIECFCVIPKPLSNTDKQYNFGLLLNNINTQVLPKGSSSLAFLKINAGLFINYNDGYKPLINQKVTLEVLSWTNLYTHPDWKINVSPQKIAEGYTDSSGFTTFSISLHDTINPTFYSYIFTGEISWELQVSANGKTKNIVIDSSVITSKINMLSDEELPAAFVMNYHCQLVSDKNENIPSEVFLRNERLPLAKFGILEIFNNGQDCVSTQISVGNQSIQLENTSSGYRLEGNKSDDSTLHSILHQDERWDYNFRIPDNVSINPYLVSAGSENIFELIRGKNILANHTSWHYSDSFGNFYVGWVKKTQSDPLEWLIITESFNIANSALNYNSKNIIDLQSSSDLDKSRRTNYGQLYLDYGFNSHRFNNKSIAVRQVNFNQNAPESIYNWEIFYHTFIRIAREYYNQHHFEEARKWFHYIFDPTTNDSSNGKARFWNFLPFRNNNQEDSVNKSLEVLANPKSSDKENETIQNQIAAWLADPFNPFAVARLRINAYEWFTVTSYIKNLIEWGDQIFRRDTRESINEATLLYVMASDILGRKPMSIQSSRKSTVTLSYRELAKKGIDGFGNTWATLLDTPYGKKLLEKKPQGFAAKLDQFIELSQLSSVGSPYFCVPPNEKLLELWDTVADRLFKIRNCKNFDGVTRNLPLFDSPIDPEILIRAKLKGVSVSDALNDIYAPPPLYRFSMVLQKATDLCNEVKALGGVMLSAIEKKEAEHLSLLRSGQEIEMQKLVATVRQEQIKEADANIDALKKSKENIIARVMYLQRQMGGTETTLDADGVPVLHESYINQPLANFDWTVADLAGLGLTKSETDQIVFLQTNNIFSLIAGGFHTASGLAHTLGASLAIVPAPADGPAKVANATGDALSSYGTFFNTMASHYSMLEKRSGMMAGWQRRRDEWLYQAKTAVLEIKQIDRQIIASEIRKAIAEKELGNHYKQIEHTKTLDDYIRKQKFSNETLYTWMESRLSIVYKSAFDMAYEQAKKAEKAFRFELGEDDRSFITPGYWDTMQRGLLAGEGLMQDLKRMEIAFMDRNKRDFEITKHISLTQLDLLALLQLRATSSCNFDIPEVLFDMDFPGQYFRRIKSVSISMPCIAGPYTSVSATLSLTGNKLRRKATDAGLSNGYSSNQSSIATSHGQNDSGMFELNFRDERYLPFEGCGADSSWNLELPELKQFDYDTISDVVIHLKYTARFDSGLKQRASDLIEGQLNALEQQLGETGLHIPISLKHDMPNELNLLKKNRTTEIQIGSNRLPYFAQAATIQKVILFAKNNITILTSGGQGVTFADLHEHLFKAEIENTGATVNIGLTHLPNKEEGNQLDELILVIKYVLP